MLHRFRPLQQGSLVERFLALRQEGSVRDYRTQFEILATPLEGVPDLVFIGKFISGLKIEIKAELRTTELTGLQAIMDYAQKIEAKNSLLREVQGSTSGRSSYPTYYGSQRTTSTATLSPRSPPVTSPRYNTAADRTPPVKASSGSSPTNFQRLTAAEIQTK